MVIKKKFDFLIQWPVSISTRRDVKGDIHLTVSEKDGAEPICFGIGVATYHVQNIRRKLSAALPADPSFPLPTHCCKK